MISTRNIIRAATAGLALVALCAPTAGAAVLTPVDGAATFSGTVAGVRLKSFQTGQPELYVGVDDLGVGANRAAADAVTVQGQGSPYTTSFSFDGVDQLQASATRTSPAGTVSATYVSTLPAGLDTVQIALSAQPGETVTLSGITLDGDTIADLSVTGGFEVVCLTGLTGLADGFTFGATFTRPETQTNERNKFEVTVGDGTCPEPPVVPEFPVAVAGTLLAVLVGGGVLTLRRRRSATAV